MAKWIAEALRQNGEAYHAGAIDYAVFCTRNRELWERAERGDVVNDVKRELRDAH